MQAIPDNVIGTFTLTVEAQHTAAALGNVGVEVLATPYVVWMVEAAAYEGIRAYLDPGEGVAGIHVNCHHVAPAAVGSLVRAEARLVARDRARLSYTFQVTGGATVLAHGTYESFVLPLEKLFGRLGSVFK